MAATKTSARGKRGSPVRRRARGSPGRKTRRAPLAGGSHVHAALIIVDPQNDFCEGGSLAVADAGAIFPEIAKLQKLPFGTTFITQDWHPKDHASFASNHKGAALFELRMLELDGQEIPQVMWPNHCVQGSTGAEFHPALRVPDDAVIIRKGTNKRVDSYSGFGDGISPTGKPKQYEDTGLRAALKARGIKHVVVCGLATDYCVKSTALDAKAYGFDVTFVESAAKGVAAESTAAAILDMRRAGITIVDTPAQVSL